MWRNVVGGQGDTPKHLFHGTGTALAPKILREGLKPQDIARSPTNYGAHLADPDREPRFGVYLSRWYYEARCESYRHQHGPGVVFRVKVKGLPLIQTTRRQFASLDPIPAKRLKVVG